MNRLVLVSLLLQGCSTSPETGQRDSYRMLVATVINTATGEAAPGWHFTVDHHLGGYSGPPLREHMCQPYDDIDAELRIVVAPAALTGGAPFERLGINIENIRSDRPHYRASFYVSSEMWQKGTWKELESDTWWYEDATGSRDGGSLWSDGNVRRSPFRPKYRLQLRDVPQAGGGSTTSSRQHP